MVRRGAQRWVSEGVLEVGLGDGVEGADLDDAGVVDEEVDGPEDAGGFGAGVECLVGVAEVACDGVEVGVVGEVGVEVGGGAAEFGFVAGEDGDACAFLEEFLGEGEAEAAGAAGDEGGLSVEGDGAGFACGLGGECEGGGAEGETGCGGEE
jgi:hypothetical protein